MTHDFTKLKILTHIKQTIKVAHFTQIHPKSQQSFIFGDQLALARKVVQLCKMWVQPRSSDLRREDAGRRAVVLLYYTIKVAI